MGATRGIVISGSVTEEVTAGTGCKAGALLSRMVTMTR